MIRVTTFLALSLLAVSIARGEQANPFHNFNNPYDVDGNGVVEIADLNSVVDVLKAKEADPLIALESVPEGQYWDTSNNGRVNAADALIVINHLLSVPEPGSVVTAGAGLLALAGFCWRRSRRVRSASGDLTPAVGHG